MNYHLNLFRFFSESTEKEFIENNLSRAFALCLTNNNFFFNEYIRSIVTHEDYQYLFSSINSDTKSYIDIQIDTSTIETESYKTVYAVAMTSDCKLSMHDFLFQQEISNKKNITDIIITIKDIIIIIEVKRTGEDCISQLYNQVLPFVKANIEIKPIKYSWQEVVKLLEKVKHVLYLGSQNCIFVNDFLVLSEVKYPEWFEPKPFNVIQFSHQRGTTNYTQLQKRIRQGLAGVSSIDSRYEILNSYDRLGITLPFIWATELIPEFETYPDNTKDYITFYIWPGNTKQQGYSIFNKSLDWTNKQTILIEGFEYELEIVYNIKLSHYMGKYITGINYYEKDVLKVLHTSDNFYNQSGKWDRDKWPDFEKLLDDHFKQEFNWREYCKWESAFLNSDRNYLFMSLGFEVSVYIPFSKFKTIDKTEDDIIKVSDFIYKIADSFKTLIS